VRNSKRWLWGRLEGLLGFEGFEVLVMWLALHSGSFWLCTGKIAAHLHNFFISLVM